MPIIRTNIKVYRVLIEHVLRFNIFFLIVIIGQLSFAQPWGYHTNSNDIDGKTYSAVTIGSGGRFPYTKPLLSVSYFEQSEELAIWLSDVGYTGCDNNEVIFVFDSKRKYRSKNFYTLKGGDGLWIRSINGDIDSFSNIDLPEYVLLHELMKSSKLYVRVENDCHVYDYTFGLSGSSSAINKVVHNGYLQKQFGDSVTSLSQAIDNLIRTLRIKRVLDLSQIDLVIKDISDSIISLPYRAETKIKIAIIKYLKEYGHPTKGVFAMKLIPSQETDNRYVLQIILNKGSFIQSKTFEELVLIKLGGTSPILYDLESY